VSLMCCWVEFVIEQDAAGLSQVNQTGRKRRSLRWQTWRIVEHILAVITTARRSHRRCGWCFDSTALAIFLYKQISGYCLRFFTALFRSAAYTSIRETLLVNHSRSIISNSHHRS